MAGNLHDNDAPIAEINIVPLVDIILVVLIIFMVTAPLIIKPSINVNLPKAASGESTKATQLQVTLAVDNRIFLNGSEAKLEEITAFAQKELEKDPDLQAIIAADQDVPHGQVIKVLDGIKSSGVKKFAISIDKK